jgi:hypothetical protein
LGLRNAIITCRKSMLIVHGGFDFRVDIFLPLVGFLNRNDLFVNAGNILDQKLNTLSELFIALLKIVDLLVTASDVVVDDT